MTQDEIIRMAQTCGFSREDHHAIYGMLVRFAELVAAAERDKVLMEIASAKNNETNR